MEMWGVIRLRKLRSGVQNTLLSVAYGNTFESRPEQKEFVFDPATEPTGRARLEGDLTKPQYRTWLAKLEYMKGNGVKVHLGIQILGHIIDVIASIVPLIFVAVISVAFAAVVPSSKDASRTNTAHPMPFTSTVEPDTIPATTHHKFTTELPYILYVLFTKNASKTISSDKTETTMNVGIKENISPTAASVRAGSVEDHLCPIGSISYEDFELESPPIVTGICSKRPDYSTTTHRKRLTGYELVRVECNKLCKYYSMDIEGYKEASQFTTALFKARTAIIRGKKFCTGTLLSKQISDLELPQLNWLKIELEESNECLALFELLSTWKMPNLELLSLRKVLFSPVNKQYVHEILKKSSSISTLKMSQMVASFGGDPFQGISFPELVDADVEWNVEPGAKAMEVIRSIESFISSAPNIRDLKIRGYLPFANLIEISRQLKKVKHGAFSVTLEDDGKKDWNKINLYELKGLKVIQTLLLTVSLIHKPYEITPSVVLTGFGEIKLNLDCLTVMTKEVRPIQVEDLDNIECTEKLLEKNHKITCCSQ